MALEFWFIGQVYGWGMSVCMFLCPLVCLYICMYVNTYLKAIVSLLSCQCAQILTPTNWVSWLTGIAAFITVETIECSDMPRDMFIIITSRVGMILPLGSFICPIEVLSSL